MKRCAQLITADFRSPWDEPRECGRPAKGEAPIGIGAHQMLPVCGIHLRQYNRRAESLRLLNERIEAREKRHR